MMHDLRCLWQLVLCLQKSPIHHFHAQVHLLSALKAVKIKATHHFLQRKSSELRLPIKPTSMYQMEVDGFVLFFVFFLDQRVRASIFYRQMCVTALFPDESDVICHSFCHPLPPSLSPSGLLSSLVQVRKWRDSDVMALHWLSRWIATQGDLQKPHTHTPMLCCLQTHTGRITSVHRHTQLHTRMTIQSQTPLHAQMHTCSSELLGLSAEGRSIWHSVLVENRPREASWPRCLCCSMKHAFSPERFPLCL